MKILIISATFSEIAQVVEYLSNNTNSKRNNEFKIGEIQIDIVISGVGMVATTFSLTGKLIETQYDLVINAGIAGAINRNLDLGETVNVISEEFADIGVNNAQGEFSTIFDLGFLDENSFPFTGGKLHNTPSNFIKNVKGLTVNTVTGDAQSINKLRTNFSADIETMEGAAVFYVCQKMKTKFLEIRSISNYVEPRNKDNWNITLAVNNLNLVLIEMIKTFIGS